MIQLFHALIDEVAHRGVSGRAEWCPHNVGNAADFFQEFLVTANWDHLGARDRLQRRLADAVTGRPSMSARMWRHLPPTCLAGATVPGWRAGACTA